MACAHKGRGVLSYTMIKRLIKCDMEYPIKVSSIMKRQECTKYGATKKVDDAIWTTREVAKELPRQLTIWDLMRE